MAALVRLLRALPDASPEALTAALSGEDPVRLVRDAARHGLSGVVWQALSKAEPSLPASCSEALRRQALAIAARTERVKRLLFEALDALARAGVTSILLKGHGLGHRFYPDPLSRPATDVDLWVRPEDLERSGLALRSVGLLPERTPESPDEAQEHQQLFGGAKGTLELHFRLLSSFGHPVEGAALWDQSQPAQIEGHSVRYLRAEHEVAYLALHAMHHLMQRLSWLFDIKLLLRRHPDLDWEEVAQAGAEMGLGHWVYLGLQITEHHLAAGIPLAALERLAPSPWRRRLAGAWFSEDRLAAAYFADRKPAWFLAKVLLAEDLHGIARLSWHRLVRAARTFPERG